MKKGIKSALTAAEAKAWDEHARKRYGISTLVLMENAGRAVAEEAIKSAGKRVAIFCGKGNNGGDGFVAARHLLARGVRPQIFLAGNKKKVRGEAKENLDILLRMKVKVCEVNPKDLPAVRKQMRRYNVIIDALFGVGLAGTVKGVYSGLIDAINGSSAYIISVDIPSGLDATVGNALGACVCADKTVTFVAQKRAMKTAFGKKCCGRVVVKDIGLPFS